METKSTNTIFDNPPAASANSRPATDAAQPITSGSAEKTLNPHMKKDETAASPAQSIMPGSAEKKDPTPPALPQKLIAAGMAAILMKPKQAFLAAGGTAIQFNREANFAAQYLMENDFLFQCAKSNPDSLVEAIKNVALTGLTLNQELKLAYLLPRKGKVKFQSSYMGKMEILLRAGVVRQIEANLVYEKDKFFVSKGTNPEIIHEPDYFADDRGDLKGGYYIAVLPGGEKKFDILNIARIRTIEGRSDAAKAGKGSPWDTDFEEMAKKTIINYAYKTLPKTGISESMLKVLEVVGQSDSEEFEEWTKSQQDSKTEQRFDEVQYAQVV
jgi:recombination protein RecT